MNQCKIYFFNNEVHLKLILEGARLMPPNKKAKLGKKLFMKIEYKKRQAEQCLPFSVKVKNKLLVEISLKA